MTISTNGVLRTISGFIHATSTSGQIAISSALLQDLDGFYNLQSMTGGLFISSSPALRSLAGLCQLRTVTGSFSLTGTTALCCRAAQTIADQITVTGGTKSSLTAGSTCATGTVTACTNANNYTCNVCSQRMNQSLLHCLMLATMMNGGILIVCIIT